LIGVSLARNPEAPARDRERRLGALDVGHPQVHQHHVGLQLAGQANAHAAA
jgi:hypothetical protein